ncbi:MAG: 3-oxoacyl-ACP reductase, partial [Alphaproteobacteria bacterium]
MDRLRDRVALVFGAGSIGPGWGNGKACAVAYARAGAAVACVDVAPAAGLTRLERIVWRFGADTQDKRCWRGETQDISVAADGSFE